MIKNKLQKKLYKEEFLLLGLLYIKLYVHYFIINLTTSLNMFLYDPYETTKARDDETKPIQQTKRCLRSAEIITIKVITIIMAVLSA